MMEARDRSPDNDSLEATWEICRTEVSAVSSGKVMELVESVLALRAEVERMRLVVEAAEKHIDSVCDCSGFGCPDEGCDGCRLSTVIAAYREKKGTSDGTNT